MLCYRIMSKVLACGSRCPCCKWLLINPAKTANTTETVHRRASGCLLSGCSSLICLISSLLRGLYLLVSVGLLSWYRTRQESSFKCSTRLSHSARRRTLSTGKLPVFYDARSVEVCASNTRSDWREAFERGP